MFSVALSQIIDHQPDANIFSNTPLYIEVFSDFNYNDISAFSIFYKTNNQEIYIKDELTHLVNNNYSYTIRSNFLTDQYIEYYFLMEFKDATYQTFPREDPHNMPLRVRIENVVQSEFIHKSYLDADITILSPLPNEEVFEDDLIISLSYYGMKDLNLSASRILIDGKDFSLSASIRENNLILIPPKLSMGEHKVEVYLTGNNGLEYNPITWTFFVISDSDFEKKLTFNGRLWNDYSGSDVDNSSLHSNTTNLHFNAYYDWIDIKAKFKKSSQENKFDQAKDRYSLDINLNDLFRINLGDFYPEFNKFMIRGNRVRGVGIRFEAEKFRLSFINGQLARATQGNPLENGVTISDYSYDHTCTVYDQHGTVWNEEIMQCLVLNININTEQGCLDIGGIWDADLNECWENNGYDQEECKVDDECIQSYDPYYLDISRSDYTFERNLQGIRLEFGKKDRINFGFNILKAKDDISSVNQQISGAMISLPDNVELLQTFNSDQFLDLDGSGDWITGEPIIIDYDNDSCPMFTENICNSSFNCNWTGTECIIVDDGIPQCDFCNSEVAQFLELPDNLTGTLVLINNSIECEDLVNDGYISQSEFNAFCISGDISNCMDINGNYECLINNGVSDPDDCNDEEGVWYSSLNTCLVDNDDTYPLLQYVWDVQVLYENIENELIDNENYLVLDNPNQECAQIIIADISNAEEICESISYCSWDSNAGTDGECSFNEENEEGITTQAQTLQYSNFLTNHWDGNSPKDNLVLGTDFSFTSTNQKTKVKAALALSLYNENTWNDAITMSQLDNIDGYEDCYVGRTYDFSKGEFPFSNFDDDLVDCIEFECINNTLSLSYKVSGTCDDTFNDVLLIGLNGPSGAITTKVEFIDEINDYYDGYIIEYGSSINDIPDIEDYSDEFLFTLDNLPFPSIIDKYISGEEEDIKPYDFFNSPDVAYDIDFTVRASKHQFNFGYKQVGESFYSLSNPYIQTNTREQYFSDRMRLLDNRLFLILKLNNVTSGFISDNPSVTNKYDVNFSYYPGIDLPSFNFNVGNYSRESGEQDFGYESDGGTSWVNDQCISSDSNTTWTGTQCINEQGEDICLDGEGDLIDACLGTDGEELFCYSDDIPYTSFTTEVECESDDGIVGDYDNRISTNTNSYNFSLSHSIDFIYRHDLSLNYYISEKKDNLLNERTYDMDGN